MKKIKADISIVALLFWIIVLILFYTIIIKMTWPTWLVGFAPIYFVIQIIIFKMGHYRITEKELVINQYLKKYNISLDKIKSYEIKEASFLKRLITGLPKKTIFIKYNKYDSIELLTANEEIIKTLPNNT
jgi:uncharacterized membrane protein YdbT with pleckstrin-like domain